MVSPASLPPAPRFVKNEYVDTGISESQYSEIGYSPNDGATLSYYLREKQQVK